MPNFFTENQDLQFILNNFELDDIVALREKDYSESKNFIEAPVDLEDAMDNYKRILCVAGDICANLIAPRARDVDKEGATLKDGKVTYAQGTYKNLKDLSNADLMGAMLPRSAGGLNFPVSIYSMMNEMVSRADASLQNLFGLQDIAETIHKFGSDEQKAYYLPKFSKGEVDGSMDLTEPDAGSDLQAVQLKATLDKDTGQWYLNGMKRFITNGCAKVHLVLARSEAGTKDGRGLSMFICESCPELLIRRIEDKLGIHGSPTCELQFNNVPATLVGLRRRGISKYVMSLMNGARVAISTQAIGIAEAAYQEALKYANEREQFGKAIIKIPAVYDMLLNARVQVAAARVWLYETCKYVDMRDLYEEMYEGGEDALPEGMDAKEVRKRMKDYSKIASLLTPLGKAMSTELANKVAYDAIQIHGGTGFMKDFNVERFYRDARITNIYEGTTQLQYLAAVGGVLQNILGPIIEKLSLLPFEGPLRKLASQVDIVASKLEKAVSYILSKNDSEYHDLMTERLCLMQTIVYVSYLLLRDALKSTSRLAIAEIYIADKLQEADMHYHIIMSANSIKIDKKDEILV